MQEAKYVVTYACGDNEHPHTQIIYLRGSMSPAAVEETLRVLGKTWCPACHRRQQQLDAEQYSHMFGLVPLVGTDADQLEYAEVIRARLLQTLITSQAKPKAVSALIALVNLCVEADFWIEHRMILWNMQRTGETLADILACAFEAQIPPGTSISAAKP
jgi:hypothetical protein